MRAPGDDRLIAARDLVLALSAGLDAGEAVINRPLDRLVIAELEVEERHLLGAPPITAVERVFADEIERSGNRPAVAAGEEQQQVVAHPLSNQIEELPRQIGLAPFSRSGVLIEGPHCVPLGGTDLGATKNPHLQPLDRNGALFAQRFALATRQGGEEIIE